MPSSVVMRVLGYSQMGLFQKRVAQSTIGGGTEGLMIGVCTRDDARFAAIYSLTTPGNGFRLQQYLENWVVNHSGYIYK